MCSWKGARRRNDGGKKKESEELIVEKDDKNQKIKKKLGSGYGEWLRLVGEGNE